MIVNVEFFDENAIENVVTSLNYKVDKTIFFGYQNMLEENKSHVEKFLTRVCGVQEVKFCVVDEHDLVNIMDTITEQINQEIDLGNDVFFDLTGGEHLILVAFGIISNELKASMHIYDIKNNKISEYRYEGSPMISETAEYHPITLNLDDFISLYGGTINYRMHKDFKESLSEEDMNDVASMWNLSRKHKEKWVYYSALLRKFEPNSNLTVRIEAKQFLAEVKKIKMLGNISSVHQFLDECQQKGFLTNVYHENGIYIYKYKNETIKNYFWDGGSILEMYAFLKETEEHETNDCRVGVHIDWDGMIYNYPGKDVLNEIDIMSINNNLPTFISCKIGNVDQMALYELEAVANRFGGKYAKKVLVVAKDVSPGHLLRANEMDIEVRRV